MVMRMLSSGRLMMSVLNEADPSEDEWGRWLALLDTRAGADLRCVVEVYGHYGPSARQRRALAAAIAKADMRAAVLSDSMLVRSVVTAVGWLGVANSAFNAGQLDAAAQYLELTAEERQVIRIELPGLRKSAGVKRQTIRWSLRPRPPSE